MSKRKGKPAPKDKLRPFDPELFELTYTMMLAQGDSPDYSGKKFLQSFRDNPELKGVPDALTEADLDALSGDGRMQLGNHLLEQSLLKSLDGKGDLKRLKEELFLRTEETTWGEMVQLRSTFRCPRSIKDQPAVLAVLNKEFLSMLEMALGLVAKDKGMNKTPGESSRAGKWIEGFIGIHLKPKYVQDIPDAKTRLECMSPAGTPSMTSMLLAVRGAMYAFIYSMDHDKKYKLVDIVCELSIPLFMVLYMKLTMDDLWKGIVAGNRVFEFKDEPGSFSIIYHGEKVKPLIEQMPPDHTKIGPNN
jgi:hypothetical protein